MAGDPITFTMSEYKARPDVVFDVSCRDGLVLVCRDDDPKVVFRISVRSQRDCGEDEVE